MRELWERVDRLIDRASDLEGLRAHGLHLLAARRWRARGLPVPDELKREEVIAASRLLAVPAVLGSIRAAYDGPLILLKGPELGAHYPDPALRPFADLDVLVPDAHSTQQTLIRAGFRVLGDPESYMDKYHGAPLAWRNLPVAVEVHQRPKWVSGLEPPDVDFFSVAVRSRTGLDNVLALPPAHHAMIAAAHSWAHEPLRRALDLVDVAALADAAGGYEPLRAAARSYGMSRLWRTTEAAAEALIDLRRPPRPLRLWARNLTEVRERTVFETHVARWLADFWALPPHQATARTASTLAREVGRSPDEQWSAKLARVRLAVRNAADSRIQHDREIRAMQADHGRGSRRARRGSGLQAVLYHHLSDKPTPLVNSLDVSTPPALFERHLIHFLQNYDIVDLDRVLTGRLPSRPLLITFDDGYRSIVDVAAPILRRHGVPSVFFISSAFLDPEELPLDNLLSWLAHRSPLVEVQEALTGLRPERTSFRELMACLPRLSYEQRARAPRELCERFRVDPGELRRQSGLFLEPDELGRLSAFGMEVGNHTRTHLHCRAIRDEAASRRELVEHRGRLESLSGSPVRSFSYPYGSRLDATAFVEQALVSSGHEALFLVESRPNPRVHEGVTWNRVSLRGTPVERLRTQLELLPRLRALHDRLT